MPQPTASAHPCRRRPPHARLWRRLNRATLAVYDWLALLERERPAPSRVVHDEVRADLERLLETVEKALSRHGNAGWRERWAADRRVTWGDARFALTLALAALAPALDRHRPAPADRPPPAPIDRPVKRRRRTVFAHIVRDYERRARLQPRVEEPEFASEAEAFVDFPLALSPPDPAMP